MNKTCIAVLAAALAAEAAANLVPEGMRDIEVEQTHPGKVTVSYKRVNIPAGTEAVLFEADVEWKDVERGAQKWFDARIMSDFVATDGKKVASGPAIGAWTGTSKSPLHVRKAFVVEGGAAAIALMPGFLNAKTGTLVLKNMSLKPMKGIDVELDGYVRSKPVPAKPGCKSRPLATKGNRIVDAATGREVWLQGLNICSLEWGAKGDNIMQSVTNAVTDWNANVVRLCVKSSFWFGRGPWQKKGVGAELYHKIVDDVADYMEAHGGYLLLDLHEFRAPEWRHASFWLDAATRYGNRPGVLFGLLNEPHDISWDVWRNGGMTGNEKNKAVHAENKEALKVMSSIGMQRLFDVVRSTGARNLVTVGGLDWAYDLSGILNGYALDGEGIVYETHVYPWKRGWKEKFLRVAERHPVLVGEVGAQPTPMPFEKTEDFIRPEDWVPGMLATIQKHRLSWTAWCFHPKSSPCMLSDWNYTPTPYWGAPAKEALKGRIFTETRTW